MSFSINTSSTAQSANFYAGKNTKTADKSLNALSSSSNLLQAVNDAAGLAIADKLLAQIAGSSQAIQNSNETIGLMQVADGGVQSINDNLDRVRVLTLQASNDTLSDGDRANIQKEIDGLLESSDDIAKNTSYNGINLLDGTGGSAGDGTFIAQDRADAGDTSSVNIGDVTITSLIGSVDVTTQAGRDAALGDIDTAQTQLSSESADLGATQNALISNIKNTSLTQVNIASAESQIRDVDFAQESANFSKSNILSQIGSFAQAQANSSMSNLAGLLG